jgi:hypothetical protein
LTPKTKDQATSLRRTSNASEVAAEVQAILGEAWLAHIYRERIRKGRTRAYEFAELGKNARVEIQHTLLGVELKAGRRRLLCPDLATARYLSVFARLGCPRVAVPYDITKISQLADELESSWHRMFLLVEHSAAAKSEAFKSRVRKILIDEIRAEIADAGAGASAPEFQQSTRQRN